MKDKWGVPKKRSLADFAPEVVNIAKQLGAAITTHNVVANDLRGEHQITNEHVENNKMVRSGVASRGIILEDLDGVEDIKKIERRHASEAKKLTTPPKPPKVAAPKKAKLPAPKRAKKPTVEQMVEWFRTNHERAVESCPRDNESETGWAYELADVRDILEGEFSNASEAAINDAEREIDDEGPWIDGEVTDALEQDRMNDAAE